MCSESNTCVPISFSRSAANWVYIKFCEFGSLNRGLGTSIILLVGALVLGASVLEPDLDDSHVQACLLGELLSHVAGRLGVFLIGLLEYLQLLRGYSGPGSFLTDFCYNKRSKWTNLHMPDRIEKLLLWITSTKIILSRAGSLYTRATIIIAADKITRKNIIISRVSPLSQQRPKNSTFPRIQTSRHPNKPHDIWNKHLQLVYNCINDSTITERECTVHTISAFV